MEDNIIIGNNVALSRNISNYPFPHKLSQTESQVISKNINNIIQENKDLSEDNFNLYNMKELSEIAKVVLVERQIISNKFANSEIGSFIINKDKTKCILINDEDHIKIKVYEDKFNMEEAFNIANKIDDILSEKID